MTETERKALALMNEVLEEWDVSRATEDDVDGSACFDALCRAIEQHDAFRQEVSDAVEAHFGAITNVKRSFAQTNLKRFILAKPDPLVEVLDSICIATEEYPATKYAERLRAALADRGLKITNI